MTPMPKCLLLPIDGSNESLKPVEFIRKLYPDLSTVKVVLCYFQPPLAPVYREKPDSPEMARKRADILKSRETDTRNVLTHAREVLAKAGFPEESVVEHVQEKASTMPRDACLIAGVKKADALVMQKQTQTTLESLLRDDPTHGLLQYCTGSPLWITDGNIDPSRGAVCILNEDTSIRAADHAAFMLADTRTEIVLLHAARGVAGPRTVPVSDPGTEIENWFKTEEGKSMERYLHEAAEVVRKEGIPEDRVKLSIIPSRGNVAVDIIEYCRNQGIGIVVIGHSSPKGKWSFLKSSVTKRALEEFRDMAIWVNQ